MQLAEKQELIRLLSIYQNELVNIDNTNKKELVRCEKKGVPRWSKEAKFTYGIKGQYEHSRIIISKISKEIQNELLKNWEM